jgi:hypothetical protein
MTFQCTVCGVVVSEGYELRFGSFACVDCFAQPLAYAREGVAEATAHLRDLESKFRRVATCSRCGVSELIRTGWIFGTEGSFCPECSIKRREAPGG